MTRARGILTLAAAGLAALGLAVGVPGPDTEAATATLTPVSAFGNNPGGMQMHVYAPSSRPARPGIVVAMHGCGGSGPAFAASSEFSALADRYGFVVIYPTATQQAGFGTCFDTWSAASKTRGGGSDPTSLISMIQYVERQYGGDPHRVFATGSSSGGMMTQHMLALYPDVFAGGAAFMGVPFGCFADAADYAPGRSACTGGRMDRTPQQWGDLVRGAYPGYSGARPPIQLWHGTADQLVPYSLLGESIDQWTNVFGLSRTPTSTDAPVTGWTRQRFAPSGGAARVEAYHVQGAGHSLPSAGMAARAISFFGLDTTTATPSATPSTTPSATPSATTTPTPSSTGAGDACSARYRTAGSWQGGFLGEVTVTAGPAPLSAWSVTLSLPSGVTVQNLWNAQASGRAGAVTVKGTTPVAAGASTAFGFTATGDPGRGATVACTTA